MSNKHASGIDEMIATNGDNPETFEAFAIKNIAPIVEGTLNSSKTVENEYQSKSSFNDFEYWNRSISNIDADFDEKDDDDVDDDDEDIYANDNEQIFQIVEYKEGKPVNR